MTLAPWLTAAELSGLAGMPSSEFRTRARLKALNVPSRVREGRLGGGGREFDTAALPAETRRALLMRQVQQAPTTAVAVVPAQPLPAAATALVPAAQGALAAQAGHTPTREESACADARALLVRKLLDDAQAVGGVSRATEALAAALKQGTAPADVLLVAERANRRQRVGAGVPVSARTLFRWVGEWRRGGWWALLPKPVQAQPLSMVSDDVAAVLKRYMRATGEARNLTHCAQEHIRSFDGRPFDDWRRLYEQARRALPKVDRVKLIKARHMGAERAAKLPFKRRVTDGLQPNDVWLVDGHTFKAKVRHPDHGQPFAPEVTLAIDAATRLVVGWSASLSENTIAVGDCMRHAVANVGVPAIVYSDNGAGESAKVFDCPLTGLFARMGTDHRTGLPGHPQGHGLIERSWQTHMIRCARQFGSYQGGDADARMVRNVRLELARERTALKRAASTGDVVRLSVKAPSWAQFLAAVEKAVWQYNHEHRHRALPKHTEGALEGKRMTPAECWAMKYLPEDSVRLDAPALRHLFMPAALRKAVRGEVQWLTAPYSAPELMQSGVDEQFVRVHYDIHDASRVWVWTVDGRFVCEAVASANAMGYFPAPVIERAREKRVQGIVKRREAQIDTARAELNRTLEAPGPVFDLGALSAHAKQGDLVQRVPELVPVQVAELKGRPTFFDSAADRYEWLMQHRSDWQLEDTAWLAAFVGGQEYDRLREYFASRGLAWGDGDAPAFNQAG